MTKPQHQVHDKPAPQSATAAEQKVGASVHVDSVQAVPTKSSPRWTARRTWAWAVAGVTGALLAAAGLSVATPIVVQPGTTAGYLYFPKATMAEELLKAEVQELRAELSKLRDETVKALSDGLVRLRTDTMDWNAIDAATYGGWSLHRHISELYTLNQNNNVATNSLISRIAALEQTKFLGEQSAGAFDRTAYGSGANVHIASNDWKICIVSGTGEMGPGERHFLWRDHQGWFVHNIHGGIRACRQGENCKMLNWHCFK